MRKNIYKKILSGAISMVMCLSVLLTSGCAGFFAPNEGEPGEQQQTQQPSKGTPNQDVLTLNSYNISMYVGGEYALKATKMDKEGKTVSITNLEYEVEKTNVLDCVQGVLVAKTAGETYVNVKADGLEVACFVTVLSGKQETGLSIRFAEEQLYTGVEAQAYVYATDSEGAFELLSDVEWTVDSNLSINENGVVTPLQPTETATITAKGSYNGEEYVLEKTISVINPVHYYLNQQNVIIATTKTYSGEANNKYVSTFVNVYEYNLVTGETNVVKGAELEVESTDESFSVTKDENGKVVIQSNSETATNADVYVLAKERNRRMKVSVSVAYAMSSIEDMDKLALASLTAVEDLSKSYVLVNDIDYENKTLYTIASWVELATRRAGVHWKYLLDKTANGYELVDRENVGKDGYGLSDNEFVAFANENGINPANTPFTGVFDGNGYAIKNAKLMYGSYLNSETVFQSAGLYAFGYAVDAKICNIAFNVSLQNPTNVELNLNQAIVSGALQTVTLATNAKGYWNYFGSAIVGRGTGVTFESTYVDFYCDRSMQSGRAGGCLVGWGNNLILINNVVHLYNNANQATTMLGLVGETGGGNVIGKAENNLAIGVSTAMMKEGSTVLKLHNGQNGNWWSDTHSWSDLFSKVAGSSATNVIPVTDVAKSFDTAIWNVSKLNASDNGAPTLINGCSIPLQ